MLRELNEFGFTNLTGIDYSDSSIQLAKEICAEFDCTLKQQDILQMNQVRHDDGLSAFRNHKTLGFWKSIRCSN